MQTLLPLPQGLISREAKSCQQHWHQLRQNLDNLLHLSCKSHRVRTNASFGYSKLQSATLFVTHRARKFWELVAAQQAQERLERAHNISGKVCLMHVRHGEQYFVKLCIYLCWRRLMHIQSQLNNILHQQQMLQMV